MVRRWVAIASPSAPSRQAEGSSTGPSAVAGDRLRFGAGRSGTSPLQGDGSLTTAPSVAVLVGSLRKDSINRKLANALVEIADPFLRLTIIEIGGLPFYNQDDDGDNPPHQWTMFR